MTMARTRRRKDRRANWWAPVPADDVVVEVVIERGEPAAAPMPEPDHVEPLPSRA